MINNLNSNLPAGPPPTPPPRPVSSSNPKPSLPTGYSSGLSQKSAHSLPSNQVPSAINHVTTPGEEQSKSPKEDMSHVWRNFFSDGRGGVSLDALRRYTRLHPLFMKAELEKGVPSASIEKTRRYDSKGNVQWKSVRQNVEEEMKKITKEIPEDFLKDGRLSAREIAIIGRHARSNLKSMLRAVPKDGMFGITPKNTWKLENIKNDHLELLKQLGLDANGRSLKK